MELFDSHIFPTNGLLIAYESNYSFVPTLTTDRRAFEVFKVTAL